MRTRKNRFAGLLILPKLGRPFYHVAVSYKFLYFAGAVLIAVFVANGVLITNYFGLKEKAEKVRRVETMEKQIAHLSKTAEQIERELETIQAANRRIEEKTGIRMERVESEDVWRLPSRSGDSTIESVRERLVFLDAEISERKKISGETEEKIDRLVNELNRIPSIPPIHNGKINSNYGYRSHPITGSWEFHEGIDLSGDYNTPIYSSADGRVTFSDWRYGYGLMVTVDHGNGFTTHYAHASRSVVREGERVRKGQIIAFVGRTGTTTGTHVHYEIRYNGRIVNPAKFLSLTLKDVSRF